MNDPAAEEQSTRDVLMVRPGHFTGNEQTAASNRFQQLDGPPQVDVRSAAIAEFNGMVAALEEHGVRVRVFDDVPTIVTPDSLFPNNWVSFHADGTAVLYPMLAPNRRLERRREILDALVRDHGFRIDRVIDLTYAEQDGLFLEGTGSLVLDRRNRIAYACLSPRTDRRMLDVFARKLDYEPLPFTALDRSGHPVYHTNVMMSIGSRFAAVCASAITDADRRKVLDRLESTGHDVVELGMSQMEGFAGNVLEVQGRAGGVLAVSAAGLASLDEIQRSRFESLGLVFATAPLPVIERIGGGSARCMIAEIHLPSRVSNPIASPA
jgi:hypothetical protein